MIFTLYIAILTLSLFISVTNSSQATRKVTEIKKEIRKKHRDVSKTIFEPTDRQPRFPHLSRR